METRFATPAWRPSFTQPIDRIVESYRDYAGPGKSFVVFENGTCVAVANGLSQDDAARAAARILRAIVAEKVDIHPQSIEGVHVLISYQAPAFNFVFADVAAAHWPEIEVRHQEGLLPGEVLVTPFGPNIFEDYGKKALLGRMFMYLDALRLKVVRIELA